MEIFLRDIDDSCRHWVRTQICRYWGAEDVVAHGAIYRPHELSGLVAYLNDEPVGIITYHIQDHACEIVTLNSFRENIGLGTLLLETVRRIAREHGCRRLWLITTNDNWHAQVFYRNRGFELVAVHENAVDYSRQLKPEIPLIGENGLPIKDEFEFEMRL